ncbi:DUF952 domain-containing protein [Granulosicoccus sp. 3-233]|uniref:DUF952 domain-containing protein n=1 Tax=Granulosicoccus sp. 3-233 TaxID=3417969 RepID=UPI003D356DCC
MSEQALIYHIALDADIAPLAAGGDYRCASLDSEGFIHCCSQQQLHGVTARYYADIDDVHLLIIAVDRLTPALILENTVGGDELFPHVYGPLAADCIVDCIPYGLQSGERLGVLE